MRADMGLYPSLGRYFSNMQELADAGCMSRTRLTDCLHGRKQFTDQEKVAIYNNIRLKEYLGIKYEADLFDERFKAS